jgi:hypothetical protein
MRWSNFARFNPWPATVSALLLTGCLLLASGCAKRPTQQRFVLLLQAPESLKGEAWHGTYALDTKTEQLCLTFEPSAFNSVSAIPTCLKLYRDFPD